MATARYKQGNRKNKQKKTEIKNIPLARIGGGMSFNNKKAMSDSAIAGK